MEVHSHADASMEDMTRRRLLKKAAYTAPAVFAIAAAPRTALGYSGPRGRNNHGRGHGKPNKNRGPYRKFKNKH